MIEVAIAPSRLTAGRIETLQFQLVNATTKPCFHIHLCLKLPAPIVLLSASPEIDIPRLGPGEGVTRVFRLKARKEGTFHLTTSAFSYRDGFGQSVHPKPIATALEILPELAPNLPPPALRAGIVTGQLSLDSWMLLEGWVENAGVVAVRDIELRIHLEGGETSRILESWSRPELHPGQKEAFQFPVRAREKGSHVPVRLIVLYRDLAGKAASFSPPDVKVSIGDGPPPRTNSSSPIRVLLVSAEAADASQPKVLSGQEFGRIAEALHRETASNRVELHYSLGTRVLDLQQALLSVRPQILHFSGHGDPDGLWFLNDNGRGRQVRPEAVARLFQQSADYLRCVVLNACNSAAQATKISQFIPYVIGMTEPIRSSSAIAFSSGFYRAIAEGLDIEQAFAHGCVAIDLCGCSGTKTPVLKKRDEG